MMSKVGPHEHCKVMWIPHEISSFMNECMSSQITESVSCPLILLRHYATVVSKQLLLLFLVNLPGNRWNIIGLQVHVWVGGDGH